MLHRLYSLKAQHVMCFVADQSGLNGRFLFLACRLLISGDGDMRHRRNDLALIKPSPPTMSKIPTTPAPEI